MAFYEQKVLGVNNMIKSYTHAVGAVWMEIFARGFIAYALAEAPYRKKTDLRVRKEERERRVCIKLKIISTCAVNVCRQVWGSCEPRLEYQ